MVSLRDQTIKQLRDEIAALKVACNTAEQRAAELDRISGRALAQVAVLEQEVAALKVSQEAAWGTETSVRYWERQCAKVERDRDALRGLVRTLEWASTSLQGGDQCPSCGRHRGEGIGHDPACRLAALL